MAFVYIATRVASFLSVIYCFRKRWTKFFISNCRFYFNYQYITYKYKSVCL